MSESTPRVKIVLVKIPPTVPGLKWKASTECGCWGLGATSSEAIGEAIRTDPELFGVELVYPKETE